MKSEYKRLAIQLLQKINHIGEGEDQETELAKELEILYEAAWSEGYDEAVRGRD